MVPKEIWDQSITAGKTAGTMPAGRDWSGPGRFMRILGRKLQWLYGPAGLT